jgi:hypothetical protein
MENPRFPAVVEPNCVGPVTHKAIYRPEHDCYVGRVEHGLFADLVHGLDKPIDACGLSGDRNK